MKKWIPLLLALLLLAGCGAAPSPMEEAASVPTATAAVTTATEPSGFYDPDAPLELATNGALRCYPLGGISGCNVMLLGEDLLLFSHADETTTLQVLSGETLYPKASLLLDFFLTPEGTHLRTWENGISFYDDTRKETVVLDSSLREVARINAPKDILGEPLLSEDRTTLYYCTSDAIRALDLESGISRCLRETAYPSQFLVGLHQEDTVLQFSYSDYASTWETLFLSTETGTVLHTASDSLSLATYGIEYYASFWENSTPFYIFGSAGTSPQAFYPADPTTVECTFLPEDRAAVTLFVSPDAPTLLEYYDLDTGARSASLELDTGFYPWGFVSKGDGKVCFLHYDERSGGDILCIWDTSLSPSGDTACYTGTHYTRETPDYEGLAACTLYAEEISKRYGIEVLVYKRATEIQPWDYDMEYEYQVSVIQAELAQLDARLAHYPDGLLETLAQRFDGVTICLVQSLTGSAESGSLESANGIQFWEGHHAYIALAAGQQTEHALYHELCHLIDTVVLNESGAYDRWDELNPTGFSYDYDYVANQSRNSGEYLREESRYFIDMYSMSFPKEDRARIMEYAMTGGNASYFQSAAMQAKLKLLCEGIREAFGLRKSPETFLWEQYLNESLAYTK